MPFLSSSSNIGTMNKYIYTAIVALLSSLVTALIGALSVYFYIVQPFHKQAVDLGFAQWTVVDNASGRTVFQWNEAVSGLHKPNPDTQDIFAQNEKPLPEIK